MFAAATSPWALARGIPASNVTSNNPNLIHVLSFISVFQ
jgi:hypothetical protein